MFRIQSSARSQHSAVTNHQSSSTYNISHPLLAASHSISCHPTASAVTPQHQLSARSISCHPTTSAVTSRHQLSPRSISCQPITSAVILRHQLSPRSISRHPAASAVSSQHQLSPYSISYQLSSVVLSYHQRTISHQLSSVVLSYHQRIISYLQAITAHQSSTTEQLSTITYNQPIIDTSNK